MQLGGNKNILFLSLKLFETFIPSPPPQLCAGFCFPSEVCKSLAMLFSFLLPNSLPSVLSAPAQIDTVGSFMILINIFF